MAVVRTASVAAKVQGGGLHALMAEPAKRRAERTRRRRTAFCTVNPNQCSSNITFTDMKSGLFYYPVEMAKLSQWLLDGTYRLVSMVNHLLIFNVCGGTLLGTERLVCQ
jgi:hypothetical protein